MPDTGVATIEMDGDRQIVRLPEAFRLPGREVLVSRSGEGLKLEPVRPKPSPVEVKAVIDELERYKQRPSMDNGREQLSMLDGEALEFVAPPSIEQMRAGLARLDEYKDIPFMVNGREQPAMPDDDDLPSFEA